MILNQESFFNASVKIYNLLEDLKSNLDDNIA